MSYKTLKELTLAVHEKLRLVPGTSTQVYNEDYTANLIKEAFRTFAREPGFWWSQFMDWVVITPDGVTGKPTIDFNASNTPWQIRHEDIRRVYALQEHRSISQWNSEGNPTYVTYTRAYYEFIGDPYKLLRILPITTTESFNVHRRLVIDPILPDDLVVFDDTVISNHVAWRLATGNGDNPSNGVLFANLFEVNYNRIKTAYSAQPVEVDIHAGEYPRSWYEVP